ncbi:MAG: acyl carrier protein [Candidatus Xenobia bacterium]
MSDVLVTVQEILRDILNQPTLELTAMTTAQEVPGWDSLAHINLVAAVEEEFRIRFAMAELQKLQNVGEMVALIERKAGRN